jgi:hypothetical protein
MKIHPLCKLALMICLSGNIFLNVSNAQIKPDRVRYIIGTWKSVKFEYYGYNKFDSKQAEQIKSSKLYIAEHRFMYDSLNFIGPCDYDRFSVTYYDTTHYLGIYLEYIYTRKELSKLLYFKPVDKNGEYSCFNECTILFLKQDTLISICGGYTNYLIKER